MRLLLFFQRSVFYILYGEWISFTIHKLCFRVQIARLLDGRIMHHEAVMVISFLVLLFISFIWGPIYCGKLCPTGALTEYLSKLIPEKVKVDWTKYIDAIPVRYGVLTGFIILPLFKIIVACAYCNFYVFDLLINFYLRGYIVSLTSGLILTLLLWLVVLGVFTKGGRGYCNFLCPVGAFQNFIYYVGRKFSVSYKLKAQDDKCVGCGKCVNNCPMRAINLIDGKAKVNLHNCILCGECMACCPIKAIKYVR